MGLTLGIDATNLRGGGGLTHLVELLRAARPADQGIDRVVVWGNRQVLDNLDEQPWLEKLNPCALDKGLLQRAWWQRYSLSQAARDEGCDVLFVPGGSYAGNFHPVITMSQSLLPFDMKELRRYSWSSFALKLLLLRWTQSSTFRRADGVIFLTQYAQKAVLDVAGPLKGLSRVIAHGVNDRFKVPQPKAARAISDCSAEHPFRLLYVSTIDQYKHQWHVAEAVAALRRRGWSVVLDMVGPAYPPALARLDAVLDRIDPRREWAHYHGALPYAGVHELYARADAGICASSCETFGLGLLESMAAGLPMAYSDQQAMAELMGQAGLRFSPERPEDIAHVLAGMIESTTIRDELAWAGHQRAQHYSWQRCAEQTFVFLLDAARRHKGNSDV